MPKPKFPKTGPDALTPGQLRVLAAIIQANHDGVPCTLATIRRATGIRSANGVMCHLKPLESKGLIVPMGKHLTDGGSMQSGSLRTAYRLELFVEALPGRKS